RRLRTGSLSCCGISTGGEGGSPRPTVWSVVRLIPSPFRRAESLSTPGRVSGLWLATGVGRTRHPGLPSSRPKGSDWHLRSRHCSARAPLARAVGDREQLVRLHAIKSLGRLGRLKAAPGYRQIADKDESVGIRFPLIIL